MARLGTEIPTSYAPITVVNLAAKRLCPKPWIRISGQESLRNLRKFCSASKGIQRADSVPGVWLRGILPMGLGNSTSPFGFLSFRLSGAKAVDQGARREVRQREQISEHDRSRYLSPSLQCSPGL